MKTPTELQLDEAIAMLRHLETARLDDKEHVGNKFQELELRLLQVKLDILQAQKDSEDRILSGVRSVLREMEQKYVPRELYSEVIETLEGDIEEGKAERKELKEGQSTLRLRIAQTAAGVGTVVGVMGADKLDLLKRLAALLS